MAAPQDDVILSYNPRRWIVDRLEFGMYDVHVNEHEQGREVNMSAEDEDPFREMTHAAMDLLTNIGIMTAAVAPKWPEDVQENWAQFQRDLTAFFHARMGDAQDFGEFYDDNKEE